jgi:hypothetical protein
MKYSLIVVSALAASEAFAFQPSTQTKVPSATQLNLKQQRPKVFWGSAAASFAALT